MNKKILITGASGFTGRYLIASLSQDASVEVYCADRTVSADPPEHFSVCDFLDATAVSDLLKRISPDEIYHLVGSYTNNYEVDYASNVCTTKHILDALRDIHSPCRVLLVGSSAEYGFPTDPEKGVAEHNPLLPVSIYGLVKVYQSALMGAYARLYQSNVVLVRPFNLSGVGVSDVLFAGKMRQEIERYKRGEIKRIVTGKLSVERDYIDIKEAITYYRLVMERGVLGEAYNVGSGKGVSLKSFLE